MASHSAANLGSLPPELISNILDFLCFSMDSEHWHRSWLSPYARINRAWLTQVERRIWMNVNRVCLWENKLDVLRQMMRFPSRRPKFMSLEYFVKLPNYENALCDEHKAKMERYEKGRNFTHEQEDL